MGWTSTSNPGQFAAVDEILSGRENLVLIARLRHFDSPGLISDDLLRRFALSDAGGRRVGTYSGGRERQTGLCAKRREDRGRATNALVLTDRDGAVDSARNASCR